MLSNIWSAKFFLEKRKCAHLLSPLAYVWSFKKYLPEGGLTHGRIRSFQLTSQRHSHFGWFVIFWNCCICFILSSFLHWELNFSSFVLLLPKRLLQKEWTEKNKSDNLRKMVLSKGLWPVRFLSDTTYKADTPVRYLIWKVALVRRGNNT